MEIVVQTARQIDLIDLLPIIANAPRISPS